MRMTRIIILPIVLLAFTLSSTGFIIQKQFCHTCDFEYKDVFILDIKESSHTHHDCNVCIIAHGQCSCSSSGDVDTKETDFFLLELLFSNDKRQEIKPIINELNFQNFVTLSTKIVFVNNGDIFLFSLPPPQLKNIVTKSLNVLYSVFIL